MQRHVRERPRHQFGRVAHSPEDFGLDPGRIRERFSRYIQRFDLGETP